MRVIVGALLLVLLLSSLDQTIVSTALPTIVCELGGIEHLSWVVTAYLLASTIVLPLYGKLGDLYGRKIVLQAAIVIFLIGSALCGISQNMPELIAFRAVQGLGGGGLFVSAFAVVGDVIAPRERGRYQGYFSGVFAASTVLGPLVGGFFVDNLSWRWIFYVNLPLGAIALFAITTVFRWRGRPGRHAIDYVGAGVLAVSLASLVLFTSLGGTTFAWGSPESVVLAVVGVGLLPVFVLVEHRAREPILPLGLFRIRMFNVSSAIGFIVGLAMFGAITFLPLYLQIAKGYSATGSGLLLTPLMAGMLIVSTIGGQLIVRYGRLKPFPIVGTLTLTVGLLLLSGLRVTTPIWHACLFMVVIGLGMGACMQVLTIAVQNAVGYEHLGVATSGVTLFRQTGGSLGVALFGAIFANRLHANLAHLLPGVHLPTRMTPQQADRLPGPVHDAYAHALTLSLQPVFLAAAGVSALAFLLGWLWHEVPLRKTTAVEARAESLSTPRDADSLREIEAALSSLARREERWELYRDSAARIGLDLEPPALWLLGRLGERPSATEEEIRSEHVVDDRLLSEAVEELTRSGLAAGGDGGPLVLTPAGRDPYEQLVARRAELLRELLQGWNPEQHPELRRLSDELARSLVAEMPVPSTEREVLRSLP